MHFRSALVLSLLAALVLAAPVKRQNTATVGQTEGAGGGIGEVTGPAVDGVLGPNNVKAADQIADTLGVAQYPNGDGEDDKNALPQQLATSAIGSDGIVTDTLPDSQLQGDAEDTNNAVDEIGTSTDQIANNVLGVPCENTSPQDVGCPAGVEDQSSS
jgi:hypothetical protein